jgi:dTDP-4-dehydrorhamnose reductase
MRFLVLGATGMLGSALVAGGRARGHEVVGAGRSGPDLAVDVTDPAALTAAVADSHADVVVNTVALVSLAGCEDNPALAYAVNARPPALLAEATSHAGSRLVQISTDHFWTGDGSALHAEDAPVRLVNEYARTKFAGEAFALTLPGALVLRTNITGFRGRTGAPTFAEWALGAIEADEALTLFDDFYTSTMACSDFSEAMLDLLDLGARGVVNLASSQVSTKQEFLTALADATGHPLAGATTASVRGLSPARGESLGLDVSHAERLLGRKLPDLAATISTLLADRAQLGFGASTS